jgi:hypothetical protein
MYPLKFIFNLLLIFFNVEFQQDFILNFLDTSNIVNIMLFLLTLITAILFYYFTRKEQWISLYYEFNKRYAEIRWKLPNDILFDDFDLSKLNDENLMKIMRQYFDLCSEEFYLKNKKKWIEKELWQEWHKGIEYYMSKPAFKEAWRKVRNNEDYYTGFIKFMDGIVGI